MKIRPPISKLKGKLFLTKDNRVQVLFAVMHQKMRPRENTTNCVDLMPGLSFVFNGTNLYYKIKDEELVNGVEDKVEYTISINGHDCILEDFISQEFDLEGDVMVIVSFSMYVFEGVEYQKYLAQGIFLNKIEKLTSERIFGIN